MVAEGRPRLIFHVGGWAGHPTAQQAAVIAGWLGDSYACEIHDGATAFDDLSTCDLLVVMGLHWTGMGEDWAGNLTYQPLKEHQKQSFESYVASGRPILNHHGGIASYDDWPRFGELLGFTWVWGVTNHAPLGQHTVEVLPTGHPLVRGMHNYDIVDELYYDVRITSDLQPAIHAQASWQQRTVPMVLSAQGGRIQGAGHTVYLANGHAIEAFHCAALQQLWLNSINWLLQLDPRSAEERTSCGG